MRTTKRNENERESEGKTASCRASLAQIESVNMSLIKDRSEIETALDKYVGKRVVLNCQVGVCIFGAVMTLEHSRGLCRWECVSGEVRVGLGSHCIHCVAENLDGTLTISVA